MRPNQRCIAHRSVSGSTRSPSAVDPTTSAKITVTSLRRSPTETERARGRRPARRAEPGSLRRPLATARARPHVASLEPPPTPPVRSPAAPIEHVTGRPFARVGSRQSTPLRAPWPTMHQHRGPDDAPAPAPCRGERRMPTGGTTRPRTGGDPDSAARQAESGNFQDAATSQPTRNPSASNHTPAAPSPPPKR